MRFFFDAAAGRDEVDAPEETITGAVRVPVTVPPGEKVTVRFVVGWHFPRPRFAQFGVLQGGSDLRFHYATRFDDAAGVVGHLVQELERLERGTRDWVRTWYEDSTLPHWFLERTLAPASTLATTTCYRFDNGRFYAQEGEYCCDGTCQHVWNYAQSVARLFPELERDTRRRVDFGIAFHDDTGAMDYRGEAGREVAYDGQAGTIVRTYREHQMAPDNAFLNEVWPKVKKAISFLIDADGNPDSDADGNPDSDADGNPDSDADGKPDGVLDGAQYNTLDQTWHGQIPWISGLYVAALRAAAAMAEDMEDAAFARYCTSLAEQGTAYLSEKLWNAEYRYFVHRVDPDHPSTNSNHGSFADQMYGQTYAGQLDLPRVFPATQASTALQNLYRYNFLSDHDRFRADNAVEEGRWFAAQGESGLVMCAWPFGGDGEASGDGDPFAIGYFNEVWSGQEYQVAAHMFADGLTDEALELVRAVYDRYAADKRNPYYEIECSDHYARAMMSHGAYLAATGFSHHGPRGQLGFAPKLGADEDVRAAFTTAEGWGLFSQRRGATAQRASVELRYGTLRVNRLELALPREDGGEAAASGVVRQPRRTSVSLSGQDVSRTRVAVAGDRARLTLPRPLILSAGDELRVEFVFG